MGGGNAMQVNFARRGDNYGLVESRSMDVKETRVLLALAEATEFTLKAHVSKHVVFARFRKDERGLVGHNIKGLVRKGLAIRHPTHGEMTLCLSKEGLTLCKRLSQTENV